MLNQIDNLKIRFNQHHPLLSALASNLCENLILQQAGLPATVIKVEQRLEYYSALDKAHTTGNHQDFIELVGRCVVEGFEPYWWSLGIQA